MVEVIFRMAGQDQRTSRRGSLVVGAPESALVAAGDDHVAEAALVAVR